MVIIVCVPNRTGGIWVADRRRRKTAAFRAARGATPAAPGALDPIRLAGLRGSGLFDAEWYCLAYRSCIPKDADALLHFCEQGWREQRRPNFYFDTEWYLDRNDDVHGSGDNPLAHYFFFGEREGRAPGPCFDPVWYRQMHGLGPEASPLADFLARRRCEAVSPIPEFDAAFYLETYPDVAQAGIDPFEHYLLQGHREGRNPAPGFETGCYRERHLGGDPEINPLIHWRAHRGRFGPLPTAAPAAGIASELRRRAAPGPEFEERRPLPDSAPRRAKLLAYYLPQFHPIAENDAWWGRGFTEWANVARGLPRFAGHYQPRIPRDLGPYSLDDPSVLPRQAAMAQEAGIFGFVFYFYWFNGRRLLERPIEAFLADRSIEMPFCLMWANENWSRRWDGSDEAVLISQDYRDADEPALIATFARHFADWRYIRVGGRPLLMVYRPRLIPETAATIARWRQAFRARHDVDPLFVMAQSFGDTDPRPFGMEGAIEFPPHKLTTPLALKNADLQLLDPEFTAQVFDYADVAAASLAEPIPPYPLIKTVVPGWDNDARRQGAGMVLHGASPVRYQEWLAELVRRAAQSPFLGEKFVCINAWNEWAEGAYLEPDVHFGAAFLNATGRAVSGVGEAAAAGRLLLVGHDAFPAGAQHLLLALGRRLRRAHGVDVAFLLLDGGAMEAEYAALAPLAVARDAASLAARIAEFAGRGFMAALVNSAAAARAVPALCRAGVAATLLVHELPRLLRARGLIAAAREAADAADAVVFPHPMVRDAFLAATGAAPARSVVRPQGLYCPAPFLPEARARLRASLGVTHAARLALGIGFGDLRKGFDLFLQAWRSAQGANFGGANLGGAGEAMHFAWAGAIDATLREALGAELAAAAASGTFHLPGFCNDARHWFSAADVHVLASREDPYPSVVLEAMSAGLPTVAFAGSGGIPDLLAEYDAGEAVPLGDAAALAAAARRLGAASCANRARIARAAEGAFDFGAYAAEIMALARPGSLDVSVVVPSRNYARYLRERLASIFAQTWPVREVILLDDASADESVAVAEAVAAEWGRELCVIASEAPSGAVFRQWRRAAELAQGRLLWIAEADDAAESGLLAALVGAMAAAPRAVMAFADSRSIDGAGAPIGDSYNLYYRQCGAAMLVADGLFEGRDFAARHLAERNLILNASAVLWDRAALLAAFDRCGAELGTFRMAGDWRLYLELLDQPDAAIAYVAEPLNVHRRHPESVTHRLDAERHVAEVARMQRLAADRLVADMGLRARQARVLDDVAATLGAVLPSPPVAPRPRLRSVG